MTADWQGPRWVIGQLVSTLGRLPVKAAVLAVAVLGLAALWAPSASATGVRDVVFVGNNWDGTADVIDPHRNFRRVARINIIPDIRAAAVRDLHRTRSAWPTSCDPAGRRRGQRPVRRRHVHRPTTDALLIVSRPSLADVVGDQPEHPPDRVALRGATASAPTTWPSRRTASTSRSPRRPGTSSTSSTPHTGREVGTFPSGDSPHENNYSADGKLIYHASIGLVYTPADQPAVRLDQGRSLVPDRRREHQPDPGADRHGPEARPGGIPEDELRGQADGALAERVPGLLPGLVLPRLRRV